MDLGPGAFGALVCAGGAGGPGGVPGVGCGFVCHRPCAGRRWRADGGAVTDVVIRPFAPQYAGEVRALFVVINRLLSPPHMREAFEAYIERSLTEEIGRIDAYYSERDGGF